IQTPGNTDSPTHAPLEAALFAALTTALVGIFCVGVVRDVGDALRVCWGGDAGNKATGRETEGTGTGRETGETSLALETEGTERSTRGLYLGTGIEDSRRRVARVFEPDPILDTESILDTDVESILDADAEAEADAEVIHIHNIPRDAILDGGVIPLIPQNLHDGDGDEEEVEEEDINPFHHSPSSAPFTPSSAPSSTPFAPSSTPFAPFTPSSAPSAPPSSQRTQRLAPPRSLSASLSSLSDASEGGLFPGSGLFG
ncbi:hypothetical protein F5876DRAFT_68282, partial [Lentinula aff. lateritia]